MIFSQQSTECQRHSRHIHAGLNTTIFTISFFKFLGKLLDPKMSFSLCSTNTFSEAKLFELRLARLPHDWWMRCNSDEPTTPTGLTNVCWQDVNLKQTAFYHAQKAIKSFSASALPRTRWGSLLCSPDPLVGWEGRNSLPGPFPLNAFGARAYAAFHSTRETCNHEFTSGEIASHWPRELLVNAMLVCFYIDMSKCSALYHSLHSSAELL